MATVKRYGQFCAVARALDEVGDRWTLLLVRELLIAPRSYSELHDRLPGIATNLLADRLGRLQEAGLVVRDVPARRYALTPRGRALRPVLHELVRWGAELMTSGPGDDVVDEQWAALALEALLTTDAVTGPSTRVSLVCGSVAVQVELDGAGRRTTTAVGSPHAVLSGSLPQLLEAVHTGTVPAGATVTGDPEALRRVIEPST